MVRRAKLRRLRGFQMSEAVAGVITRWEEIDSSNGKEIVAYEILKKGIQRGRREIFAYMIASSFVNCVFYYTPYYKEENEEETVYYYYSVLARYLESILIFSSLLMLSYFIQPILPTTHNKNL